ncbi:hypothetical protein TNCV_3222681 [Trichonephila clavipes]|uniref:Uncharacterized protein n=1 Tax=Trichonephila clavipes TaxID=2585209 RepID=A0A8X6RKS3_TRICX|nr:hypothetical protein TNCV_3222681 [Trichonephila clavipes]
MNCTYQKRKHDALISKIKVTKSVKTDELSIVLPGNSAQRHIIIRGAPRFEPGPLDLQSNALPLSYTPVSANLCFAFRRNGHENALSGNIPNGTDHSRLRNSQKYIFLHFPEEKRTRYRESGTSRSPDECSTTALYTPRQRTFTLRSVTTDTKMHLLEIFRMVQIIPTFEILKKKNGSLLYQLYLFFGVKGKG